MTVNKTAATWLQRTADWARLGFIERKTRRAYRVPVTHLIPGECPCGAMLSEHDSGDPHACETLRHARQIDYVNGGLPRKTLQQEVIRRAQMRKDRP